MKYVVYYSRMKPVKGELPDIIYEYISNDSDINWHYTFTRNIEDAYYFDDFETDEAKEISLLLGMNVRDVV